MVEATDIEPQALERARAGIYPLEALDELPLELRERYVEPAGAGATAAYQISSALRARVRFQQHDLTTIDARRNWGSFDLVTCRNVLIYFQRDAQERIFGNLRSHIADDGVLCLGEAEWPPTTHEPNLSILDRKNRIFWAAPELASREAS